MTGAYTISGNQWNKGVHNVMLNGATPSLLSDALLPTEPLLVTQTGLASPPIACGCKAFVP
jgi:hypothetical protein